VAGRGAREGGAQADVSNVWEVETFAATDAQRSMSGVMVWPASTREKEADGAAAATSVIMSQPLWTVALMDTGADALPVQVAHREPLM